MPKIPHLWPGFSSFRYIKTGLACDARPIANSITIAGRPNKTRHARYTSIKPPPPFCPHIHGNFHTLPQPIAQPADSMIKPSRLPSRSRFFITFPFLIINSLYDDNRGQKPCPRPQQIDLL